MVRTGFVAAIACLLWAAPGSGAAHAQAAACVTPTAPAKVSIPALERPTPPEAPACVADNSCRQSEVGPYNQQVEDFNRANATYNTQFNAQVDRGNAYAAQLNQYASSVDTYLACERRNLTESLGRNQ